MVVNHNSLSAQVSAEYSLIRSIFVKISDLLDDFTNKPIRCEMQA
jgi:hypothetical protein